MGNPPGFPWARWVADETQMPPQLTPYGGDETPFLSQLLALQLGDEWNLNDATTRTRLVNWFNTVRSNWPNALLFHNNWGSQIGDANLADFYTRAHPDMLAFDTYPWQSVYDTNQPNSTGAPIPGPPTGWYGDLRRYREHARGAGIPFAIYRQTFHAVQDYDQHVFRDPSPSELRLNTFGALAFNAKMLIDFVYNTGAASLFTKTFNGSGDTEISSNGLYAEMADANKRARNFGKALSGLTPITTEGYAGYTTSMMIIRGKDPNGVLTPIPVGFLPDQDTPSANYTDWVYLRNDLWLNGWVVTNKAHVKNNGNPGDIIIAWFKPLHENLDGTNYNGQIYYMVVNGLTDPTGTAADCMQEIKLNFANSPPTSAVLIDPSTGLLQTNNMTDIGSGKRQLVLDLNGGDAALFKLNTGAPFVGFIPPLPARLSAQKTGTNIFVSMQGALGARYQLQTTSSLSNPNWTTATNVILTSSPFTFTDMVASGTTARYYRAVGVQP